MAALASVTEKNARRISPLCFVAAGVGFFLAFAGVSCNTSTAKTLLGSAGQGFGANQDQVAKANRCLDALNGYNFATYTGINLAFGTTPSVTSNGPAACQSLYAAPTQASPNDAGQAKVGTQPLELIGLIAVALGLLASIVFFIRTPGWRTRALTTALLAAAGVALVMADQLQVAAAVTDKVANLIHSQSKIAPVEFNIADYFNVNPGIGFFIVVAALGVAGLVNLFAAAMPYRGVAQTSPATPGEQPPPPPPAPG